MKKYQFKINGTEYNVHIKNDEDHIVQLEVNGTPYEVELKKELKSHKTPKLIRSKVPPPSGNHKPLTRDSQLSTIKAPLPGKILSVLIREGDVVQKDQKLMTMEAMKMENNILSDASGTIKTIKVGVGDTVLQNDVLIEIG